MPAKKYTPQEIAHLILAYQQNQADKVMQEKLQEWLEESDENLHFYRSLQSGPYQRNAIKEYMKYSSSKAWKQVSAQIYRHRKKRSLRILSYAATIALILGLSGFLLYQYQFSPTHLSLVQQQRIVPGSSKAQLILGNGQQIELEASGDTLCRKVSGETFFNDGKQLTYGTASHTHTHTQLHTLKIPRGGEYKVILADGTKVWLNAESELTYPVTFTQDTRKVILSGEAYFEVTKDTARPFYVQTGDMEVKVLGTSFNISAYPESKRQTTLLEGRVAVTLHSQHVIIAPGQQVTETTKGLEVREVNVKDYIAWREKRFVYENELLQKVLDDLQRWYDIEIFITSDKIRTLHLTANLPKYEDMAKILEIIEFATCVKFEVKDRAVIVRLNR